jgi:hypothetical protein
MQYSFSNHWWYEWKKMLGNIFKLHAFSSEKFTKFRLYYSKCNNYNLPLYAENLFLLSELILYDSVENKANTVR